MGLSTRILVRLGLPALILPLAIGVIFHANRRVEALDAAREELDVSASHAAQVIEGRIEDIEGRLELLLLSDELEQFVSGGRSPADADGLAQRLAEACRRLLARRPECLVVELYRADGTPLCGVTSSGDEVLPAPATGRRWLVEVVNEGCDLTRRPEDGVGPGRARIAWAEPLRAGGVAVVASALVDYDALCRPALMALTTEHGPLQLSVHDGQGASPLELSLPLRASDGPPLTAVADFERHDGSVLLRRPREQVLAGLLAFEREGLVAMGLVIGAIFVLIWSSLQATVLAPLRRILQVVRAFDAGAELPTPRAGRPARWWSGLLRRTGRPVGELEQLDTGLRKAILGFREGARRLEQLNASLEARVGERTLQLMRQAQELRLARDEARAAAGAKGDFVASVSHEIRTPLNGILGMSDLMLAGRLEPDQRDCAQTLRGAAESLLGIINGILDFSKLEAERMAIEEADIDLVALVEEVGELLGPGAAAKGLSLHTWIEPDCPALLRGDALRLRQVLTNLVGNALKFTESGEVVVRVRAESRSAGKVTVLFQVTDTGPGMAPTTLGRLFQPFIQAEASTAREYGGTGLGLAISKRLVELMGGSIGANSDLGRGSSFWFRVPLPRQEVEAEDGPTRPLDVARAHLRELAGLRVLVVDGHPTGREILAGTLRAWGAIVDAAADLAGGIRLAQAAFELGAPIRVAILDAELPGTAGPRAVERLRADPALAALPVVLVAAPGRLALDPALRALGVVAVLVKPLRRRALVDALRAALDPRAEAEAPGVSPGAPDDFPAGSRGRVLLAEDNPVNQKVARHFLERLGFEVEVVDDGRLAVRAAAQDRYVAILMDCRMPGLDGHAATRAIRAAEPPGRRVPILALTADALDGAREGALAAGMDDYLSKPIRLPDLAAALERWTGTSPPLPSLSPALASTSSPGLPPGLATDRPPAAPPAPHPLPEDRLNPPGDPTEKE